MEKTIKIIFIILIVSICISVSMPAFAFITDTDMQDMFEGFVELILQFYCIGLAGGLIVRIFKKADS